MTTEVERFPLPAGVADAVLNKSQLARALAVSEPTIDRWVADGLPVLTAGTNGRSYEFQLSECFTWSSKRLRAAEAQVRALPFCCISNPQKDAVARRRATRARNAALKAALREPNE